MTVRHLMTPSPVCVAPDTSGYDAWVLLRELQLSAVPVCQIDRLVGLITEPVLQRTRADGVDLHAKRVGELMLGGAVFLDEDMPAQEAAATFAQHGVDHLPVLNRDHRIVGLVARDDFVASVLENPAPAANSAPRPTRRAEP